MKSVFFLFFALLSLFCLSSLPVAYAEGSAEADDDYVDEDEEVDYVDDDEDLDGDEKGDGEEDEEDYVDDEEYAMEVGPSGDVVTFSLLPDYPDKRIIVGKEVVVLMNFINNGDSSFNLTEVGGFLHSPNDFNYYMHNFSAKPLTGTIVAPQARFSLEYSFTPEVYLIHGSFEYQMSTYVSYNSTGDAPEQYHSTLFNETVTLVEPPNALDIKKWFTRCLFLAGFCLLIYIGVGVFYNTKGKKSKSSGKKIERGTQSLDSDDGWVYKKYTPKPLSQKRGQKNSSRRKKRL